jgi:hypothetical protein
MAHKQFYFVVSGLKILGHGNPDNNLESLCICIYLFGHKCSYFGRYVTIRVVVKRWQPEHVQLYIARKLLRFE